MSVAFFYKGDENTVVGSNILFEIQDMNGNMIMSLKVGGSDLKFKITTNSYGFSGGA